MFEITIKNAPGLIGPFVLYRFSLKEAQKAASNMADILDTREYSIRKIRRPYPSLSFVRTASK